MVGLPLWGRGLVAQASLKVPNVNCVSLARHRERREETLSVSFCLSQWSVLENVQFLSILVRLMSSLHGQGMGALLWGRQCQQLSRCMTQVQVPSPPNSTSLPHVLSFSKGLLGECLFVQFEAFLYRQQPGFEEPWKVLKCFICFHKRVNQKIIFPGLLWSGC